MPGSQPLKLLFIINPVSGGNVGVNWEAEIRAYYKNFNHSIEVCILNGKTDEQLLQQKLASCKPERVIAVGGDGTIRLVASQLINTPLVLGIVPAGSANGMATELGLPFELPKALDVINNGTVKKIDIININDKDLCIHMSDAGLNARLIKYYKGAKQHGKWMYVKAALKVFWRKKLMHLQFDFGDNKIERSAYMAVIANAKKYGTGAIINPEGDLYDGKFEVVVVRILSVLELLKMLLTHKPFDPGKTEVFKTTGVTITARHKAYFQVDGEYCGLVNSVSAKVMPAALNVLLPPMQ